MQDPDEALALLRNRVRTGDLAGAREIVLPGLHGQRGALAIALVEHRRDDAVAIATTLAESGWWDPEVAATLVEYGERDHPLALRARSIVSTVTIARTRTIEEIAGMLRDALAAGAVLEAFLAAEEAIRRWPEHAELWAVVALTRSEIGDSEGAGEAIRRATKRNAGRDLVKLVEAHLDAQAGAAHDARVGEALESGVAPEFADAVARVIETAAVWGAVLDATRLSR